MLQARARQTTGSEKEMDCPRNKEEQAKQEMLKFEF